MPERSSPLLLLLSGLWRLREAASSEPVRSKEIGAPPSSNPKRLDLGRRAVDSRPDSGSGEDTWEEDPRAVRQILTPPVSLPRTGEPGPRPGRDDAARDR